mgnify:CR=1 FL=1
MTNEELIARQAKQLEELRDENANLKECARKVKAIIYCIGGPLNDNVMGYTKNQMTTFFEIVEELEADNPLTRS